MSRSPMLGHATKTDAALALREKGFTGEQIGVELGISKKAAYALLYSRQRIRKKSEPNPDVETPSGRARLSDLVGFTTVEAARTHAAKRDMSVDTFMKAILDTVLFDGLVDAVLDDADERAR